MTRKQSKFDQLVDYAILIASIIVSIILLSQNSEQGSIQNFRQSYLEFMGELQSGINKVDNYLELKEKNDSLSIELERVYLENQINRSAIFELIRLKKTINIRPSDSLRFIYAEVIGRQNIELNKSITINKGLNDLIHINSPVLYKGGLVGRIISISENFAFVQLASDHLFEISVKIERIGEVASLIWDGKSHYKLLYVSKNIHVLKGDLITTSGLSEIYPKHIKLGVIDFVDTNVSGLFSKISVKPSVKFNQLQYVSVIAKNNLNKTDSILIGKKNE